MTYPHCKVGSTPTRFRHTALVFQRLEKNEAAKDGDNLLLSGS
jgi:hypothetical protein